MLIREVYLVSLFVLLANAQNKDNCASKKTCGECIQEINCEWCIEPLKKVKGNASVHCRQMNDTSTICPADKLMSIGTDGAVEYKQDDEFSSDVENPIQIRPQKVRLSLRKGQRRTLKFKFKKAANFPVDLYYLMDLSNSMRKYKNKLASLGHKLADGMKYLTKNVKLGFGSFIDKVDLPFVSTEPSQLVKPCAEDGVACAKAYSFKNHMSLSNDTMQFADRVRAANVSGNLDTPEGGLDAMMQAIVCGYIGWRPQSTRLLIFSTDAEFHIAGDGKLAGVIEPNPAICYDNDKEYLRYDYPSVSQINYVASENNINVIFTIVKSLDKVKRVYQLLSQNIKNSKYNELDDKDGSNVVDLIIKSFNEIVKILKFTDDAPNEIDIKYTSNCPGKSQCNDVPVGKEFEFTAEIDLKSCPKDGATTKTISIRPDGINETLTVVIDLHCDCRCSSPNHGSFVPKSPECHGFGNLTCGVCNCPETRTGNNCECSKNENKLDNVAECYEPGRSEACSGQGKCRCGKCECEPQQNVKNKISGQFCQCDNFSCGKGEGGLLCSGHGECECNKCVCHKLYTGDACECYNGTDTCTAQGSDEECSGNGVCKCGSCVCGSKDNKQFTGKYCNECVSCPGQQCNDYAPCVQCQVFNEGIYKQNCEQNCSKFTTIALPSLDIGKTEDVKECEIRVDDSCAIKFVYYYKANDELIVRALDKKICDDPPNILAWILGVVAAILIAGLVALLVWKVFTTIHDRREYAKFENERQKLKWGTSDNPLYKGATTTFANPAYKRNSVKFSARKE